MKKVGSVILVGLCLISLGFAFPVQAQETLKTEFQFHLAELIHSGGFSQDQLSRVYTTALSTREKMDALIDKGQELHQQALKMMIQGEIEEAYALRAEAAQQLKAIQDQLSTFNSELQGIITIKNLIQLIQHGWEKLGILRDQWAPRSIPQAITPPVRGNAPQADVRVLLPQTATNVKIQSGRIIQRESSPSIPVKIEIPEEARAILEKHGHVEIYSDPRIQQQREALKQAIEEQNQARRGMTARRGVTIPFGIDSSLIQAAPKVLQAIPAVLLTDSALEVLKMFAIR